MVRHPHLAFSAFLTSFVLDPWLLDLQIGSFSSMADRRLCNLRRAGRGILLCYERQQRERNTITLETLHELCIKRQASHLISLWLHAFLQQHLPHCSISCHQLTHCGPRVPCWWVPVQMAKESCEVPGVTLMGDEICKHQCYAAPLESFLYLEC